MTFILRRSAIALVLAVVAMIAAVPSYAQAVTLSAISTDKASPQRAETGVTFTAEATGGATPLEYHFLYRNTSGPNWMEPRGWSADPSWAWAGQAGGTFEIKVSVRSVGHQITDATQTVTFVWEPWPAVTLSAISTDKASPQRAETGVTFTAEATGGATPLEYHFLYRNT
ncbi:MAG TPA: hypothetical protein VGQ76_13350, partial [Thermoanaerobaculia bacterium]|nr:hypothetical protein [Thermoanaerobaculia bacterium]